jgi:hypothetical protein
MPKLPRATLVLAEHRPEKVSHAAALMRDHEAVFLEESPDASFQQMLRGDLPVEDYVLTLRYMLRPDLPDPMEDLLAARALIYNKLIRKDEMADRNEPYPHIRGELQVIEVVKKLTLKNCAELFPLVRKATTDEARAVVAHSLGQPARRLFHIRSETSRHPSGANQARVW